MRENRIFHLIITKTMIDTILFDFGGVLYRQSNHRKLAKWLRLFGAPADDPAMIMLVDPENSPVFLPLMTGELKENDFWHQAINRLKLPAWVIERSMRQMNAGHNINQTMVDYFKGLGSKYQLGILSNAGDRTRETAMKPFHFKDYVDEIIISAEEGFAKPDERLYLIALERLGTTAERVVFVDDLAENILAAQQLGFHAIHHSTEEQTIEAVDQILKAEG